MLKPRLHELLSAHLDDEVTPAERAEVEARLELDPETRGERDDLAEISGMLRELPPLTAPRDLRSAVLDAIRSTPPPSTNAAGPTTQPVVTVARGTAPRGRLGALVALAATLACTFLVVGFLGPEGTPPRADVAESVRAPRNELPLARVPVRTDGYDLPHDVEREHSFRKLDERSGPTDLALSEDRGDRLLAAPADPAPGEGRARFAIRDSLGDTTGEPDDAPRTFLLKQADLDQRRGYVDPIDPAATDPQVLDALAPGDVVPFLDRTGGRVAVVEVTVIDVRRAYGEVQLLLQRQSIGELLDREAPADVGASSTERRAARVEESKQAVGDDGTFAVYVTTTPDRLTATLAALRESELVVGLATPGTEMGENRGGAGSELGLDGKDAMKTRPGAAADAAGVAPREMAKAGPFGGAASPMFRGNLGPAVEASPPAGEVLEPADSPAGVASTKKETEAASVDQSRPKRVPVENSYQLLGRAGSPETREKLAREQRAYDRSNARTDLLAESLYPEALRPAAADEIRAHRIDDESVRVLILLRPAPK